jgi:hypothetical protein
MAELVGVFNTAHSPFCYLEPEQWNDVRAARKPYREDVPEEDLATCLAKAERVAVAFTVLRERLAEVKPDLLIVIGDDQEELFKFSNFPALAVFTGASFEGATSAPGDAYLDRVTPHGPIRRVTGHPGFATFLLTGLLERGFDPAFMVELPESDHGMCHAVMRPIESLTDFEIPTVPLLLNAYYAPQVPARRCYAVGVALRELIAAYPEELRVAVIGSGGLWHTPGQVDSYLDEEFDRRTLSFLEAGTIDRWAEDFDAYVVAEGDASQDSTTVRRGTTGLPTLGGPQGGTREICNWIAAAACCEGRPSHVVDYVAIYASPIGVGFAYCTDL